MRLVAIVCMLSLAACAGSAANMAGPGKERFANAPVVWAVDDRQDIPKPAEQVYFKNTAAYVALLARSLTRPLELPRSRPAMNTNALDEVPNSTWFTNRIGRRPMTADELRRGPVDDSDPMGKKPWTVLSTKRGGAEVGFVVQDRAGVRYILKFDKRGAPEAATAAHMIVHRILWAIGYNVPVDRIVYFEPKDLVLGPKSKIVDEFGNKRKMTRFELRQYLGRVAREPGRPIRALASRFVDGVPVGGYRDRGKRADDANDRVPHQHRRDVRGLQPIAAWLGHTDIKEGNTIDAWSKDASRGNARYLVHYRSTSVRRWAT